MSNQTEKRYPKIKGLQILDRSSGKPASNEGDPKTNSKQNCTDGEAPNGRVPNVNEYSIYDYLKKTPSVSIAMLSALVAIVTFFAKNITLLSARKALAFWEIDAAFSTFGGDSIIFSAIASIIYSAVVMLASIWFSATYDAFLPHKKRSLTIRYRIRNLKGNIKEARKRIKNGCATEDDEAFLKVVIDLQRVNKEADRDARRELLKNFIPIAVVLSIVSLLYASISIGSETSSVWQSLLACAVVLTVMLGFFALVSNITSIDRKDLKKNCTKPDVIKNMKVSYGPDKFPLGKLISGGLRSVLKNVTIILIVICLLLNCLIFLIVYSIVPENPTKVDKVFQITTIDGVSYAVVYQTNDRFFLEEAEIQERGSGSNTEYLLTVYTNRQRLVSLNDISFSVYEFTDVVRAHKKELTEGPSAVLSSLP